MRKLVGITYSESILRGYSHKKRHYVEVKKAPEIPSFQTLFHRSGRNNRLMVPVILLAVGVLIVLIDILLKT